jgi:hypothetical protein
MSWFPGSYQASARAFIFFCYLLRGLVIGAGVLLTSAKCRNSLHNRRPRNLTFAPSTTSIVATADSPQDWPWRMAEMIAVSVVLLLREWLRALKEPTGIKDWDIPIYTPWVQRTREILCPGSTTRNRFFLTQFLKNYPGLANRRALDEHTLIDDSCLAPKEPSAMKQSRTPQRGTS